MYGRKRPSAQIGDRSDMMTHLSRAQDYDRELLSKGLTFLPWEGMHYRDGRTRVLVIGESHYDPERSEPELTTQDLTTFTRRNVLFRMTAAAPTDSFWRRIESIFGVGRSPEEIRAFWESIAFINLVQELLRNSRDRDLTPHWPRACRCLGPILDALQPDLALVLGAAAWAGISRQYSSPTGRKLDAEVPPKFASSDSGYREIWALKATGRDVPAIHIAHPMYKGGFRAEEWRLLIDSFFGARSPTSGSRTIRCVSARLHSQ
jgi:hypothetical protein